MAAETRILLVDDEPDLASLYAQVLHLAGYTVTIVHDAPTALNLLGEGG